MNEPVFRVSHLADAADRLGCGIGAGAGLDTWLGGKGMMAIGKAFTIQQRAVVVPAGAAEPKLRHGEVVRTLANPGELLVIDVDGDTVGATWGEAHMLRARNRGLAGVLINGYTRDREGLLERAFPVLCRGASPFRSNGRLETVAVACTVDFMGIEIRHGDVVAIDSDGFIRIRAEQAEAVIALAREIALQEQERDRKLDADFFSNSGSDK